MLRRRTVKNRVLTPDFIIANEHPDDQLKTSYWFNADNAQTHYFESKLKTFYPLMKEGWPVSTLKCPPQMVLILPHRYYTVSTRDGTAIKGRYLIGEELEALPPSLLTRGGALGHEE